MATTFSVITENLEQENVLKSLFAALKLKFKIEKKIEEKSLDEALVKTIRNANQNPKKLEIKDKKIIIDRNDKELADWVING
jgi:hypothetical protein